MRCFYDLHIHSALSPCGDTDMTPNNIVNMSILKGLDIIALSDHNSTKNLPAIMEVARDTDLLVVPGMEVESAEEVHTLCLFPSLDCAMRAGEAVYEVLNRIDNRPEIFGNQQILNAEDCVVGEERNLLVTATAISVAEVKKLAERFDGVAIPAHVDRSSYSVLSNLGVLPDIGYNTVEVSKNCSSSQYEYLRKRVIQNSDAHYLQDISEPENSLELFEKSVAAVVRLLKAEMIK